MAQCNFQKRQSKVMKWFSGWPGYIMGHIEKLLNCVCYVLRPSPLGSIVINQ